MLGLGPDGETPIIEEARWHCYHYGLQLCQHVQILYYSILLSELDVGQSVEHMIKRFDLDAQIVG